MPIYFRRQILYNVNTRVRFTLALPFVVAVCHTGGLGLEGYKGGFLFRSGPMVRFTSQI